ncbi:MAG: alpha-rhamnosidase [Prevotella sp.]|nr:alpha-rhamnosidase [Prevotella sp.]
MAQWIWYPGDFEVWLGNIFNNRRTERGAMFPPFWKQDSHWVTVEFSTKVCLEKPEKITIAAEGRYNFALDGRLQFGMPKTYDIPAGEHSLNFKVWNQVTPPALYVEGDTIHSGPDGWLATYEDKIWIDENGVAHGSGIYVTPGYWKFHNIDYRPSCFHLEHEERQAVSSETVGDGRLFDFGKETFGRVFPVLLEGSGMIGIYYGESREEALDKEHCETLDLISCNNGIMEYMPDTKAFRYIYVECFNGNGIRYERFDMYYEYAPQSRSGSFRCNDEEVNRIYDVSAYTLDLTTREFFMDGIKRDRWTWSGDAIQSYQMNYYLHFDSDCVKRTIRQLRGKDPVTAHVNTIMDYSFYWFISISDYYLYTADTAFIHEIYPRMQTLMDYCLGRTNDEGMAEGKPDDWIFVDWVDFPMHKRGILCFEQILLCKALEAMALCADICGDHRSQERYMRLADQLLRRIKDIFWDEKLKALLHSIEDGSLNTQITKFPNMMAIIYDFLSPKERIDVLHGVMLNPEVEPITTPYMRYYELEALCIMGKHDYVMEEIKAYWGGMLKEGATSFWEKYVPTEHGTELLAMYGRPYGKSLCHAWGASPLYLLGKYFLGVRPTKPGYTEFEICPVLGGLKWIEGSVPTPNGDIHVYADNKVINVNVNGKGNGIIYFTSYTTPTCDGGVLEHLHDNHYAVRFEGTAASAAIRISY